MKAKEMVKTLAKKVSPQTKAAMELALQVKRLELSLEMEKLKLRAVLLSEIAEELELDCAKAEASAKAGE